MFDRILGTILGGAVGDGWGGPFEGGLPPGAVTAPAELRVSDDTQLTIEAGGDTDTIGSSAGQIAGAAVGSAGLPPDLVARLRDLPALSATAERFARTLR